MKCMYCGERGAALEAPYGEHLGDDQERIGRFCDDDCRAAFDKPGYISWDALERFWWSRQENKMADYHVFHPKRLEPHGVYDLDYWRALESWASDGIRIRGWRRNVATVRAWEAARIVLDHYEWREEKPKKQLKLL